MSGDTFRIEVRDQPEPFVVISGELDLGSVERLRTALSGINHQPRRVTFDLRDVTFVDVAGLAAISESVEFLVAGGYRVSVLPSAPVTWLLGKLDAAGCPMTIGDIGEAPSP